MGRRAARLLRKAHRHALLVAYLATLLAIVAMTVIGAAIIARANFADEIASAKAIAAMGFIGSAVTGLIGIIGSVLNGLRPLSEHDFFDGKPPLQTPPKLPSEPQPAPRQENIGFGPPPTG